MAMKRHDIIVVSDISVYHMCNEPPVTDIVIHTLSAPAATTRVGMQHRKRCRPLV